MFGRSWNALKLPKSGDFAMNYLGAKGGGDAAISDPQWVGKGERAQGSMALPTRVVPASRDDFPVGF
jgi:hypothetical protein